MIILLLAVCVSTFLHVLTDLSAAALPEISLDTVSLALMLVRATLIVWQAVFIAKVIIEEYHRETMSLLYIYPVNRTKLIFVKLMLICGIMMIFHIGSIIFQHIAIYLLSGAVSLVSYNLQNVAVPPYHSSGIRGDWCGGGGYYHQKNGGS